MRASWKCMRAILTYTDFEVGRLVNHLKEIGQLDNTLIFISIGDNGASKEGTLNGDIDRSLWHKPANGTGKYRLQPEQDWRDRHARRHRGELSARLGAGRQHAFQVLEAGCEQRRRHAQSAHCLLAERHQGQGRHSHPVQPRHRPSSDHARSCGHQGPRRDSRHQAAAD